MNKKLMKFFIGDIPEEKKAKKKPDSPKKAEPESVKASSALKAEAVKEPAPPHQGHKLANRLFALLMLALLCLGLFFGKRILDQREEAKAIQERNQRIDQSDQQRRNDALQKQRQQMQQNRQHRNGQQNHMDHQDHMSGGMHNQMPGTMRPRQDQGPTGGTAPSPKVKAQIPPMIQPNKRQ